MPGSVEIEMSNSQTRLRPMTCEDIAAGMELVRAAGWNQTEADWKRFLEAGRPGCFVAEVEREVSGTVATIIYDDELAWIGMVLVSPRHRGRGIGTNLLKLALEHLDSHGPLTIKLDATPLGKPIYERCGFVPECEMERWMRTSIPLSPPGHRAAVQGEADAGLEDIVAMDRDAFGANRSALLRSLHRDASEFTAAIWKEGTLAGYVLGRHGSQADQLGPWIAQDQNIARELLQRFLSHSTCEHVIADCLKSNSSALELLRSEGFEFSRPLTRMVRGKSHRTERPEMIYAIVGPEFG